ncbi:dynein regulatory complex protein 9 [Octopus bimaculoides]|uniref:Dynein regulatory complex protein 9 n=1 Tax=Octopus bimaculoides TaxID=37653 RepID=A0A0L8I444_OCTBM|nr:dynein regulatory complex protein 9 [Octopus bimaculoides]|eukprot:XP_014790988.1 PREDICTED: IQ domain-containing protein G-like [Octopus bimaculoides]
MKSSGKDLDSGDTLLAEKQLKFGAHITFQHICTVLEDALDKLAVLGIIPYAQEGLAEALVKEDIEAELKNLEKETEEEKKQIFRMQNILKECVTLQRARKRLHNRIKDRSFDYHFQLISARLIQEQLLFPNYLVKVEKDRIFLNKIIENTRDEIISKCTYNHLVQAIDNTNAVNAEREKCLGECIETEKRLLQVSRQCLKVKQQLKLEIQDLDDIIEYMKVKRQKRKYDNSLASRYTTKHTALQVEQKMNVIKNSFSDLQAELEQVREKMRLENSATKTITGFLKKSQSKHEEMLEYWMDRYEQDVEVITKKLEQLKHSRSQTWEQALNMLRNYNQYETIVNDYKRQEEEENVTKDYEFSILRSAIQIQSWWRLIMVLKRLGPFRKRRDKKKKSSK